MSFKDTETTWRHYTVVSNATFVIAIAATAEVVDIAIVTLIDCIFWKAYLSIEYTLSGSRPS